MSKRFVRAVAPVVAHGMREVAEGTSLEHALQEAAIMGAMIGAGMAPGEAVRLVEAKEGRLIGKGREEGAEYGLRRGYPVPGWGEGMYGKPFGKEGGIPLAPFGKGGMPMTPGLFGKGGPPMVPGLFGKGPFHGRAKGPFVCG